MNHGREPIELEVRVDVGADFADLFEVKDALAKKGTTYAARRGRPPRPRLHRASASCARRGSARPHREAELDEDGITFRVRIEAHGSWSTCLDVVPALSGDPEPLERPRYRHGESEAKPEGAASLEEWLAGAPGARVRLARARGASTGAASSTSRRCASIPALLREGQAVPAAGLPWFMALFGRDSLITSYQALPFVPELAQATLTSLALCQAHRRRRLPRRGAGQDPARAPLRRADRVRGAAALAVLRRGRLDAALPDRARRVRALDGRRRRSCARFEPEARAALEWIDEYGDRDGDGYVEYQRRNTETGLDNQCWKDSQNSIVVRATARSRRCRAPSARSRATSTTPSCAAARLAREVWDDAELADAARAGGGRAEGALQPRLLARGRASCFALALDGDKRQVDSLTSNIGHLLWSGIVDDDKAEAVVRHLLGDGALLRLGRAHDGRRRGALQPDRLPPRHRLAARQLAHRGRAGAATATGRRPRRSRWRCSRRRPTSTAGCPRPSPATRARRRASRSSTRPPAARRPGPPARRCCSSARSSASSRTATSSAPIRTSPRRSESSRSRVSPAAGARRTPEEWARPRRPRPTWPS